MGWEGNMASELRKTIEEKDCRYEPSSEPCIGCGLPSGRLCKACEDKLELLDKCMEQAGLCFTNVELGGSLI